MHRRQQYVWLGNQWYTGNHVNSNLLYWTVLEFLDDDGNGNSNHAGIGNGGVMLELDDAAQGGSSSRGGSRKGGGIAQVVYSNSTTIYV